MRPSVSLVLFVSFITGCATSLPSSPVEDIDAAWRIRQVELRQITAWQVLGRLALRAANQGWHASLRWDRDGEKVRLDFTGPLGRGHLRLVQDSHGAELRDADQRVWRAENPETLLYRATGWALPLNGLNYWVVGLPVPATASTQQLDDQGRLKRLVQSGWDIQFLEYTRYGEYDLPSKLFITRRDAPSEDPAAGEEFLEVRLSIERWTFIP
ncbi:MAG: lipoprotein insertase outer membrane protein LolB [Gammaproteobacteria bacterium]|nr:lipoprotein insertase outer membrane protein LolB [Gammaproteobacteria bacterium]MDH3370356.1 lipoprotein insertase outer membrane protein LolB [Gammaproteobacteria bacterium]MDH3405346.1 lipoprotein insertase outer membrane protein LolB [Gammaproteobacteria bacterium]MDH3561807.1 lipoprotein insertase outer membrane protein LolB [Gammaproteobacteria bacterium]MDH5485920.1 lipoprotein insertase outer membrane protein LolB [Gammaproteobacteria bacterium]